MRPPTTWSQEAGWPPVAEWPAGKWPWPRTRWPGLVWARWDCHHPTTGCAVCWRPARRTNPVADWTSIGNTTTSRGHIAPALTTHTRTCTRAAHGTQCRRNIIGGHRRRGRSYRTRGGRETTTTTTKTGHDCSANAAEARAPRAPRWWWWWDQPMEKYISYTSWILRGGREPVLGTRVETKQQNVCVLVCYKC